MHQPHSLCVAISLTVCLGGFGACSDDAGSGQPADTAVDAGPSDAAADLVDNPDAGDRLDMGVGADAPDLPEDAGAAGDLGRDVPVDTENEDVNTEDVPAPQDTSPDAQLDAQRDLEDDPPADGEDDVAETFPPGEYTVDVCVEEPDGAVSSYLMDPDAGAWNVFAGETVPFGRRPTEGHVSYHTAFRFSGVQIPPGADVLQASLTITPHNSVDSSHQLCLNVYAERSVASEPFSRTNYSSGRPDQRLRTSAHIDKWITRCADPCDDLIEWDCQQRLADCWTAGEATVLPKDLSEVVQEVIDLDGWTQGNPLTIFVINSGGDSDFDLGRYNDSRTVSGYDETSPEEAPRLSVRFRVE